MTPGDLPQLVSCTFHVIVRCILMIRRLANTLPFLKIN